MCGGGMSGQTQPYQQSGGGYPQTGGGGDYFTSKSQMPTFANASPYQTGGGSDSYGSPFGLPASNLQMPTYTTPSMPPPMAQNTPQLQAASRNVATLDPSRFANQPQSPLSNMQTAIAQQPQPSQQDTGLYPNAPLPPNYQPLPPGPLANYTPYTMMSMLGLLGKYPAPQGYGPNSSFDMANQQWTNQNANLWNPTGA